MRLEGLDHVALFCVDVARSAAWYVDVLGLHRIHADAWGDVPTVMAAPDGTGVALFPARAADAVPTTRSPRVFAHVAFRADAGGWLAARAELRAKDIAFTEQDHDIARSLYLHDPDGHEVEVTTYDVARLPAHTRPDERDA